MPVFKLYMISKRYGGYYGTFFHNKCGNWVLSGGMTCITDILITRQCRQSQHRYSLVYKSLDGDACSFMLQSA